MTPTTYAPHRRDYDWHVFLASVSRFGRFFIWRRGYWRGPGWRWEYALDPALADEAIRRNRRISSDTGIARWRDILCQCCASLPCIC